MPRKARTPAAKAQEPAEVAAEDGRQEDAAAAASGGPRRSTRCGARPDYAGRARRSSTAAQTAASKADRGSSADRASPVESPATRVKSARRTSGQVNYEESDGEEEAAVAKDEDEYTVDDESEVESNSGDSKRKGARAAAAAAAAAAASAGGAGGRSQRGAGAPRSPAKAGGRAPRGRRGGRARASRAAEDEEDEEEEVMPAKRQGARSARGERAAPAAPAPTAGRRGAGRSRAAAAAPAVESSRPKRGTRATRGRKAKEEEEEEEEQPMEDGEEEGSGKRKLPEEEGDAAPEAKKAKVEEEEGKGEEAMDTTEEGKAEKDEEESKEDDDKEDEKEAVGETEDGEERAEQTAEKPPAETPAEPPKPSEPSPAPPVSEKEPEAAPSATCNSTVAAPPTERAAEPPAKVEAPEPAPARPTPPPARPTPPPAEDKANAAESSDKAETALNGTEAKPAPTPVVPAATVAPVPPPAEPAASSPQPAAPRENGDVGSGDKKGAPEEEGAHSFRMAWLDLAQQGGSKDTEALLAQVRGLDADVVALQGLGSAQWGPGLQSGLESQGYQCLRGGAGGPLALLVRRGSFLVQDHACVSLQALVDKDLEASSLDEGDRSAVQAHLGSSAEGQLLTARLSPSREGGAEGSPPQSLLVANACLAPAPPSANALQVCCLARELCREQCQGRVLLGRLQLVAGSPAYQLLRDGYLDDDMIEELQRHCDVPRPGKENAALVNLLWKAFQHPSSSLRSCYAAAKGSELPGGASSPAWFSSESLRVLEAPAQGGTGQACTVRLAFCPQ